MTNLMLSWQQAALLALGCGVAGTVLVYAGHVSLVRRWALHAGPFLREASVVIGLYALWQLAGNLASGGFHEAITHAWWIWDTERTLRLPSELDVQGLLLPHPLLSEIANLYYATMHFGMLIAMLVWLFARHRDGYPAVRNAMAASTAICLLISFIPVAPPRFLPGAGIVDLAARYGESVYGVVGSNAGADQLSAMPSVHVAWSILVAWAVITRARGRWRWLILLHPAVTVFVVVGTGNHYWADAIVAAAIDAAVISAQSLLTAASARCAFPSRRPSPRRRRPRTVMFVRTASQPLRRPCRHSRSGAAWQCGDALAEREGDGVQGQANARPDHRPVDPDELQVAPEQQLKLGRRLGGVPPLYGPRDQARQLIVELVGEPPRARLEHALEAFLQARVRAEAPACRGQRVGQPAAQLGVRVGRLGAQRFLDVLPQPRRPVAEPGACQQVALEALPALAQLR